MSVGLRDGLGDDGYLVTYRVISADSHPIAGSFSFVVGEGDLVDAAVAGAADDTDPGVAAALPTARWIGFAGLALAVGVPAMVGAVLAGRVGVGAAAPPHRGRPGRRRRRRGAHLPAPGALRGGERAGLGGRPGAAVGHRRLRARHGPAGAAGADRRARAPPAAVAAPRRGAGAAGAACSAACSRPGWSSPRPPSATRSPGRTRRSPCWPRPPTSRPWRCGSAGWPRCSAPSCGTGCRAGEMADALPRFSRLAAVSVVGPGGLRRRAGGPRGRLARRAVLHRLRAAAAGQAGPGAPAARRGRGLPGVGAAAARRPAPPGPPAAG